MAVSNYIPYPCQYKIDKLDNVVYIVAKNEIGGIHIDNGDAYVDGVGYYNAIDCLSVSLSENESLDERYEFVHTVNFSVRGYLKIHDLNDYYIMVRDKNDTYWLVNPYFKIKYTYTYTLDYNSNHTDYVASAKSNFPLLQVKNFTANNVKPCNAYDYCSIDVLAINVAAYSKYSNDKVIYTNDGFKVVKYLKNSCVFTEQYDGSSLSHTVKFNISFDDYKSSWHYNLLEFTDNKYAAVISTKCGVNIACGFDDGLQPSYTVTANDNQSINNIEIVLSDIHSTEVLLNMPSELPFEHDSGTTWNVIPSEYTCINPTTGVYTLRQEYDVFGNPLNNYMCLEGFEERYSEYHIVGTFSDQEQFYCPKCKAEECSIQTSMPNVIEFYNTGCKSFTIKSNSDFSITSDSQYITVSPSSGSAYTLYTINVCNTQVPTDTAQAYQLVVNYCDGHEKRFNVRVSEEPVTDCLPQGNNYEISVYAQNVVIPTTCCIRDVSASCCCTDFQIQNGFVKFRVENNDSGVERTITLTLTKCDGTTVTAYLRQKPYYTKWVYQGEQCHNDEWCSWDRMYSGETSDNINTPTSVVRYRNCEPSSTCSQAQYKWENMNPQTDFICSDCEAQYKWENMNPQTDYICNDCQVEPQYRWINLDPTIDYYCSGTTKYYKQQLQISVDGGVTWENISPAEYQWGGIAQTQSTDCGYVPTVQYRWIQTDNTICVEKPTPITYYSPKKLNLYLSRFTPAATAETFSNGVGQIEFSQPVTAIGVGGFVSYYSLTAMTGVIIPDSVTSIGERAFRDCTGLTSVIVGNSVTTIGDNAFSGCTRLQSINIPNSVTSIGERAFYKCDFLSSITIGSGVTSIGYATFADCFSLTSCTIGNSVTSIGQGAFSDCSGLTSVNIPSGVTSIGNGAFRNCERLTSIDIPSSVTSIGERAFYKCRRLASITCEATTPPSLGSAAFNYTNNCPIYVPCQSLEAYKTAWSAYKSRIQCVEPFDGKFKATYSGGQTYSAACDSSTDLTQTTTRPSGYQFTAMTSAEIGDCVTSIGRYAFQSCSGLTSITIPNSVTSIGYDAFIDCYALTNITIPNSVTTLEYGVFYNCTSLTNITIPNSVTLIDNFAFGRCTSLTSCTIGSGVTTIDENAFYFCTSLTSITIPNSVTRIGEHAFGYCYALTNCTIGSGVTSIDESAFISCTGLTSVTIGNSVTSIGEFAFSGCTSLAALICYATTPPTIKSNSLWATNDCPIMVPAASVDAYKSASGWSAYASRIQAIP